MKEKSPQKEKTQSKEKSQRDRSRGRNRKPRKSNRISDHFSNKDFLCKCGNCENKIRVSLGLVGGLEFLRTKAGNRINILKGYICPEAKEALGIRKNHHSQGIAADISIDNMSIVKAFLLAEEVPEFKGIGLNLTEKFIHVDTRKEEERVSWVVESGKRIDLTDENRTKYLSDQ